MAATGNPRLGVRVNSPYILAQSAVPVCLAPNGTVATNGIVTLGTALPTTYSGGIWLRLPSNAVVGGAAGLYWAVMSSTTQGQVYTAFADPASPFTPYIPSGTLVAAVGSNSAYTQTTASDITLVNVTVPGWAMGLNGSLKFGGILGWANSAGTKTPKLQLGGTTLVAPTRTTSAADEWLITLRNVTSQSQIQTTATTPISTATVARRSINTATDQTFAITGQLAVAADYIVIEGFDLQVFPS